MAKSVQSGIKPDLPAFWERRQPVQVKELCDNRVPTNAPAHSWQGITRYPLQAEHRQVGTSESTVHPASDNCAHSNEAAYIYATRPLPRLAEQLLRATNTGIENDCVYLCGATGIKSRSSANPFTPLHE